jgi:hypothetical protein
MDMTGLVDALFVLMIFFIAGQSGRSSYLRQHFRKRFFWPQSHQRTTNN